MNWKWFKLYCKIVSVSCLIVLVMLHTDSRVPISSVLFLRPENDYSLEMNNISVYEFRNNRVKRICRKYGLWMEENATEAATDRYYVDLQNEFFNVVPDKYSIMFLKSSSLLYCWIHKAASSSWNKIFFDKIHVKMKSSNLHTAAQRFRPEKSESLPELFENAKVSFLFVRHPFERLVSAYRDKFELGLKTDWCYKMYAGDILNITLPTHKVKDGAFLNAMYIKVKNLPRPTFAEFVAYLLRTPITKFNDHWSPYFLHCRMCQNRFSVIGQFETLLDDVQHISNISNLNVDESQFPWANKKGTKNMTENISLKYFKEIDKNHLRELYQIYRIDFEMFGYSEDEYF